MTLNLAKGDGSIVSQLVLAYLKPQFQKDILWGDETKLVLGDITISSDKTVARYLAKQHPSLSGSDDLTSTEVDHWLDFAFLKLACPSEYSVAMDYLETVLAPSTYLVGDHLTVADLAVLSSLRSNADAWRGTDKYVNIRRYYEHLSAQSELKSVSGILPAAAAASSKSKSASQTGSGDKTKVKKKDEGKFVELEGAEQGKVVVRFPPEASGYLHIGHAKAALLNQYYQQKFEGKLIMRFDDTNPAKENADFEKIILEDVALLGIKYDVFTHTSHHFDRLLSLCEQMIKQGDAFVDDTDAETMKQERTERVNSRNRDNDPAKNMKMWLEMKAGTEYGQKCCVRAKIDMKSDNGCMRDPTMYRCKPEPHPHTGDKYKVYPTYDFACPIVDSVEGVTHALRTTEYTDRDDQYYWFIEKLCLRKPIIWAYSRLNLQHTVLSKRKLTWFVNEGYVTGWDDPRFPTVRGVLRHGMTVEGLKQFIIAQGGSRSVVTMEWDKIWAFNKKVIDPIAPRYFALLRKEIVPVIVEGATESKETHPKHPKNADVGTKTVYYSPKVFVEGADAETFKEGEIVTFINWGNLIIKSIKKGTNGKVQEVQAKLNLENKDFKGTAKVTWLADSSESVHVYAHCVHYGELLTKPVLAPDDDFKDYINHESKVVYEMLGDPSLAELKKGDIIQLQRRGFYICDRPAGELDVHSGIQSPCVLIYIPDGHQKEMPTAGSKHKNTNAKEAAPQSSSGKKDKKKGSVAAADVSTRTASPALLHEQIVKQGDIVRELKNKKASKADIEAAVKILLDLKKDYKSATGEDWKPGTTPPPAAAAAQAAGSSGSPADIHANIVKQGDKVREMKNAKASKADIEAAVKILLDLKKDYKAATGDDWKPGVTPPSNTAKASGATPAQSAAGGSGGKPAEIHEQIVTQGDKVRELKAVKANKADIEAAVKILLELKKDYKEATGDDWKPGVTPPSNTAKASGATPAQSAAGGSGGKPAEIHEHIVIQGDKVRQLKAEKANKADIEAAVKILLDLKKDYKSATGEDWKPVTTPPASSSSSQQAATKTSAKADKPATGDSKAYDLYERVTKQGEKVRVLKGQKASKEEIGKEVNVLLALKAEYKQVTGMDYKPGEAPSKPAANESSSAVDLNEKITTQGNAVRQLKNEKASKEQIDEAVKLLLALKLEYKQQTGSDWKPEGGQDSGARAKKEKATKPQEKKPAKTQEKPQEGGDGKKVSRLGLEAKKEENLSDWYSQVITKAELIEYYDVSGCYIFRPWSYSIWEKIKEFFDGEIKKLGVENCYFPMFVSHSALEKEKTHIADFAPEVAWVTKSGQSELAEPIAIRPTSETVMYPAYAKWIQSHRDLPIRLNQWNNVVRWEFKHPQPFLRTREFLWQEGHTAFSNLADAEQEVLQILELYARVYEEYLAIPVVRGRKTEKEKFAGADYTTTVEGYVSASGRAIQGGTSHHLGQNFSKMFNIVFEDPETQKPQFVYQNSWGLSTRTIGALVMVHGDNKGLVLPPKVACLQVIVVPCGITASLSDADKNALLDSCQELQTTLTAAGFRVKADLRDNYSPGWKFNHWEVKGVPVRIELGPRDMSQNQFVMVRRDTSEKSTGQRSEAVNTVKTLLDTIQADMYTKAKKELDDHIILAHKWEDLCAALDKQCLILAPYCGAVSCEETIKKDSARDVVVEEGAPAMGAKGLCIPFKQPAEIKPGTRCINPSCSTDAVCYTLFGRSY